MAVPASSLGRGRFFRGDLRCDLKPSWLRHSWGRRCSRKRGRAYEMPYDPYRWCAVYSGDDEAAEHDQRQLFYSFSLDEVGSRVPVTLVLSMDEKGGKQVDVLDVQPAAAAREQIAAAVFEWQLGLHKTMLARFPSTNQNFGRSPPLHRRAPNVSRAGSVGFPQRMSRGLPECSAVACPTPSRTLSPTMPNDERQVSLESIPGSGFPGY